MSLLSSEEHRKQLAEQYDGLLFSASRWRSRSVVVPFGFLYLPTYGLGAIWIIYPVYLSPFQKAEWLPHVDDAQANVMMSATTSAMFVGWMIGALFWTRRADVYGRRRSALASAWGTLIVGTLAACAWSFYSYAFFRACLGLFIGGQAACSYLLLMEWTHPLDSSLFTFLGNFLFSVGLVITAGVTGVAVPLQLGWRIQLLLLAAIVAVPLAFSHLVLESPRWLLDAGKDAEAAATILATTYGPASSEQSERLAKVAESLAALRLRSEHSPDESASAHEPASAAVMISIANESDAPAPDADGTGNVADAGAAPPPGDQELGEDMDSPPDAPPAVFDRRSLLHLLVISFAWFGVNMLYYGLDFAVGGCEAANGCDVYVNGALTAFADLPGYIVCVPMADSVRFGRRLTFAFAFGLSGVTLLSIGAVKWMVADNALHGNALETAIVVSAFLGKSGAAAAFQLAYIYPAELFSASLSGKALGIANAFGRLACIIAPQAANIPQVVLNLGLSVIALMVSASVLLLPETLVKRPSTSTDA